MRSTTDDQVIDFGERVRKLRSERNLTGSQLSERAKISPSTLSKIENNRLSPTYDTIMRLARGLGVNVELLFSDSLPKEPIGRRSVTRSGQGSLHSAQAYTYEMLCSDISNKKLIPIVGHIKAHSRQEFGDLIAHEGEELIYILSGRVELHSEFYEPLVLEVGDCVFFDSRMGHACITAGDDDAKILWVCSDRDAIELVHQAPIP
ncbi:MAG: helix-turn-helix domain-containing protein [Stellaceae bacterium]